MVARGEVVHRLGSEGDGVQDDESDDEGVDDAARGMRLAADFEDVVDLPPPMAPDGLGAHASGASGAALCVSAGGRGAALASDSGRDRLERLVGFTAVGAAGLREVGSPASSLAA